MSFMEWRSSNERGRLRIYSDDVLRRFDKLTGNVASRMENVMIEHEDRETGLRQRFVVEQCIVWEDENYVYMEERGRRVGSTEPLSTRQGNSQPRRNRQPVGVYDDR
jgi:hypothetical protein